MEIIKFDSTEFSSLKRKKGNLLILNPDPETGKFTFTKEELETLLGEVYKEGYNDRVKNI